MYYRCKFKGGAKLSSNAIYNPAATDRVRQRVNFKTPMRTVLHRQY